VQAGQCRYLNEVDVSLKCEVILSFLEGGDGYDGEEYP
jgi:hypothetical protein